MKPSITLLQFLESDDCQLAAPAPVFIGIWHATGGDPCTTGCAYFEGGKCPAYRALTKPAVVADSPKGETVREAAARLGVSISEVRRQRKEKP